MSNEDTQTAIQVNGCTVRVEGHHPTGRHIKNSAIEQGLPIERHFCLSTQTADGQHVVADDEQVDVVRDRVFVASPHETEFEIFVNGQPVKVVGRQVTGRHIKGSAIEQGVVVEFNFILAEEDEHGPHAVDDEDTCGCKVDGNLCPAFEVHLVRGLAREGRMRNHGIVLLDVERARSRWS